MNRVRAAAGKNIKNAMAVSSKKIGVLHKITLFIIGFILNLLTISIFLKALNSIWGGIFAGVAVSIGCGIFILKKNTNPSRRVLAKGVIASAIIFVLLTLILWTILQSAFEGIAS